MNHTAAFAITEGRLHNFLIVGVTRRRDTPEMTPIWLVRFNDALPWLNPLLGLVAGVLAAMVISAAAGRLPVQPAKPAAPAVRIVQEPATIACKAALPPEWQELSRYD